MKFYERRTVHIEFERKDLEEALCEYLERQGVTQKGWSYLHFTLHESAGEATLVFERPLKD